MNTIWIIGLGVEYDGWGVESIHATENGALAAAEWLVAKENKKKKEEYGENHGSYRARFFKKTQTPAEDNEFDSHLWSSGHQFIFVREYEVEK